MGLTDEISTTINSISDLYNIVKHYDKDFKASKDVTPALLNDDGTPKVYYHGTLAKDIQAFDKEYIGSRFSFDEQGFFFTTHKKDIEVNVKYRNVIFYHIPVLICLI